MGKGVIGVVEKYRELWGKKGGEWVCHGGRCSGKSRAVADLCAVEFLRGEEIIVLQATQSSMRDGIRNEIITSLQKNGGGGVAKVLTGNLNIENLGSGNIIHFIGYGDDPERTKSFRTKKPAKLVIFEELQQCKEYGQFEQARISMWRNMKKDGKMIMIYNPPPNAGHWLNVWAEKQREIGEKHFIWSSWEDVREYISDFDLAEIKQVQEHDPERYRWLYLGEINGVGSRRAIPTYNRSRHKIGVNELATAYEEQALALVIGCDNSVVHDKTGFVPILLFKNKKAYILEPYYYDPVQETPMDLDRMAKGLLTYIEFLQKRFGLGRFNSDPNDVAVRKMKIIVSVDCASIGLELILHLQRIMKHSRLGDKISVLPFTKKNIMRNNSIIRTAFTQDKIFLVDTGFYYSGARECVVPDGGKNIIEKQLETVCWNEQGTAYERAIENDLLDALIYGINTCYNGTLDFLPAEFDATEEGINKYIL